MATQPSAAKLPPKPLSVSSLSTPSSSQPISSSSPSLTPSLLVQIFKFCFRAQWLVGGTCAVVAIAYPQVEVYGFLVGAFTNAFISKGLKRIIRQERPLDKLVASTASDGLVSTAASGVVATAVDAAVFAADELGVAHPSPTPILQALPVPMKQDLGHGMPSSHAMSLFYFASYLSLAFYQISLVAHLVESVQPHPFILLLRSTLPHALQDSWETGSARIFLILFMYLLISLECWTRIRRKYHTWQQIVVGACLGTLDGIIHHQYIMPYIRNASKDVPPLSDRSPMFILGFTVFMVLLAALTLERHTQRLAKRIIKSLLDKVRSKKK